MEDSVQLDLWKQEKIRFHAVWMISAPLGGNKKSLAIVPNRAVGLVSVSGACLTLWTIIPSLLHKLKHFTTRGYRVWTFPRGPLCSDPWVIAGFAHSEATPLALLFLIILFLYGCKDSCACWKIQHSLTGLTARTQSELDKLIDHLCQLASGGIKERVSELSLLITTYIVEMLVLRKQCNCKTIFTKNI